MKDIRIILSENSQILEMKFSIYLNRRVFVMQPGYNGPAVYEENNNSNSYPCHAEQIKKPCPLLFFSQSDYLTQIVRINSHT